MARQICERAWHARRRRRQADRDHLNSLRGIDYDDWQEELARNALSYIDACRAPDTGAPQRRHATTVAPTVVLPCCGR
eukprot:5602622-Pyramimonas_sp.AAC.1